MLLITRFDVIGRPAPQGSKTSLGKGRFKEQSPYLDAWRNDVRASAGKAFGEALVDGPLFTRIIFYFPRPKSHYIAGNPERPLKDSAPFFYASTPDLDKLQRSTNDALTGVIWVDDAKIAGSISYKVYSSTRSGAQVSVYRLTSKDVGQFEQMFS